MCLIHWLMLFLHQSRVQLHLLLSYQTVWANHFIPVHHLKVASALVDLFQVLHMG